MLSRVILGLRNTQGVVRVQLRRNLGVSAVALQKNDPIQELFLNKIRDYAQKSKAAGGKLVDSNAAVEKSFQDEVDRVEKQYATKGLDFSQFPTLSFSDSPLQAVGVSSEAKSAVAEDVVESTEDIKEDPEKPYWAP